VSWLAELLKDELAKFPTPLLRPSAAFGFDDVRRAIDLIEKGVDENKATTETRGNEEALAVAADPTRSFLNEGIFTSMALDALYSEMTFPMILRRSLLIAICSHVEHVLRRWCGLLEDAWGLPAFEPKKKQQGESDLHRCMRYLRDDAALAIHGFEGWAEWQLLEAYRKARNALTHDGGIVRTPAERETIAALPHLELDDSGLLVEEEQLHLLRGACEAAAENAMAFFERLTRVFDADPRARPQLGRE